MKSNRKGPYINNPMSLPRLGKCFFFFSFFLFALEKQFWPNVQVFYLVLSFGLSPVTLKCRIIFIQLRVNGPKLSYNSIILKGKKLKKNPLTVQGSLGPRNLQRNLPKSWCVVNGTKENNLQPFNWQMWSSFVAHQFHLFPSLTGSLEWPMLALANFMK